MRKLTPLFFTFLLFFTQSLCSDPLYKACIPQHCGDGSNISYPFYIRDLQNSFCGYPGFELRCGSNGAPILSISQTDFIVRNISYRTGSMQLQNSAVSPNQTTVYCPSGIRNVTFDPTLFVIDNYLTPTLILISNCSKDLTGILERYRIRSCGGGEVVMLQNDANFSNVREHCGNGIRIVTTPVDLGGENGRRVVVDGSNYWDVTSRGFWLRWRAGDCDICERSGGRCGFNMTTFQFRCFCSDRPHRTSCRRVSKNRSTIFVIAVSSGLGGVFVAIVLCFIRKFKWRRKTKNHLKVEDFLKNNEFLGPKRYSYSQVKKMTNSFKLKLGEGGFGSVYRGVLSNGNLVAVKVLNELKGNGEDFINEVASVGRTSHINIVSLVGFSSEGHQRSLIYEFMPNGSLERFIYNQASSSNSHLGWERLHQIAIGIARGLEYLHSGCNTRILHFDIKPHNILLDKDFCPKISDFGLAKLFPGERSMISMSCMRGTPGYIAPELFSRNFGQVSHKSDVYSYGMMILEMVGGKKNIKAEVDHTSETYFPHWIYKKVELHEQLGSHEIVSGEEHEMTRKMIIVGLWCIQTNPLSRPTISKVLEMLEGDLATLEIPPKPYLSSPPRSIGFSSTG